VDIASCQSALGSIVLLNAGHVDAQVRVFILITCLICVYRNVLINERTQTRSFTRQVQVIHLDLKIGIMEVVCVTDPSDIINLFHMTSVNCTNLL